MELTLTPNWIPPTIAIIGILLGILLYRSLKGHNRDVGAFLGPSFIGCLMAVLVWIMPVDSYNQRVKAQKYLTQLPKPWQILASTKPQNSVESGVLWRDFKASKPKQITIEQYRNIRFLIKSYDSQISTYVKSGIN